MAHTLASAAETAGVTKPTLWRWIKSGKVSASKLEDGTYRIDAAELHRYLESVSKETPPRETPQRPDNPPVTPIDTFQEAVALRYEVEKLKALLEAERQRTEEWRAQADRWATQAERLAIAPPAVTPSPPEARGWWPFRRRA